MEGGFQRFLLRHRAAAAAAIVGLLLVVLALSTLLVGDGEEEPAGVEVARRERLSPEPARTDPPPAVEQESPSPSEPPSAAEPEPVRSGRSSTRTVEESREAERDVHSPPPREREVRGDAPEAIALADLLGPLGGVADRRGWTAILGSPSLTLKGDRLLWSAPVVEDGFSHLALGIRLEPFGGAGSWWTIEELDGEGPEPFRVAGLAELDPAFADDLRRADGPIAVQLAAFRLDEAGRRYLVASYAGTVRLAR